MVVISLKSTLGAPSNNDGFLYETTSSTKVDDLIESLVEIHNARLRSCLIMDSVRGLAMHGVMKRPEDACTDEVQELIGNEVEKGPNYTADPSGLRTGNPPCSQVAEVLNREVAALEEYIGKHEVQKKIALTIDCIEDKINNVRGAVTIAYPMGLPDWDLARMALDEPIEKLKGTYLGGSVIDANDASLWACNKEFLRGQLVSDRLGSRNEKTKVIAKLTTKGAGPPAREPIVSEVERNAMSAFYFKRQEDLKQLAQADEDDYLNSEWADPKGMKRNLQGLNDVKAPGLRF
eukprot:CAMPEP_0172538642 /NCGR_PEP_ID=MMETSP1067-20121228/10002_1 /TAXON_ID=265564 ORGANISM="Thalassiosira punctigera, Strain Tpunct2005C2" /NCGR_SAMPLE_ID=MMETSP1067 /ASSEMBLY_ACC=CAM_ASM_000444 /LENGTH=290 /DNA_ID=CAMNT_0013324183 /DNA_START=71 /DNA_END=943 /DNA_ORIENTATION=-